MGHHGSMLTNMASHEPVFANMGHHGLILANMDHHGPILANMGHHGPIFTFEIQCLVPPLVSVCHYFENSIREGTLAFCLFVCFFARVS